MPASTMKLDMSHPGPVTRKPGFAFFGLICFRFLWHVLGFSRVFSVSSWEFSLVCFVLVISLGDLFVSSGSFGMLYGNYDVSAFSKEFPVFFSAVIFYTFFCKSKGTGGLNRSESHLEALVIGAK